MNSESWRVHPATVFTKMQSREEPLEYVEDDRSMSLLWGNVSQHETCIVILTGGTLASACVTSDSTRVFVEAGGVVTHVQSLVPQTGPGTANLRATRPERGRRACGRYLISDYQNWSVINPG